MKIDGMTIEDILGMAVKTELEAHNFYKDLADKVANDHVKSKILSLAGDEMRHKRLMEEMYRKMIGKEPETLPTRGVPDILKAVASLQINDRTQVMHVLDMAMEAELAAAKFYNHGATISPDSKTRSVFEQLVHEEDGHYNYLAAEKSALTGDLYWFSINDSAMLEE